MSELKYYKQLNDGDEVIFLPFSEYSDKYSDIYFYIWIGDSFRKMFLMSNESIYFPLINDLIKNTSIFKNHYGRRYYSLVCINGTLSYIHYGTFIVTKILENKHFLIDNPRSILALNIVKKMKSGFPDFKDTHVDLSKKPIDIHTDIIEYNSTHIIDVVNEYKEMINNLLIEKNINEFLKIMYEYNLPDILSVLKNHTSLIRKVKMNSLGLII
jgi:hypothetical protein